MSPGLGDAAPLRIVLVDDDELDRMAVRRLLGDDPNLSLREYDSGEAAIEGLARAPCDCLLLDYYMPGTDGLEVLEQLSLRELEVPTIMLTGAGDEELAVSSMRRGALDYMAKDRLDRRTLMAKIHTVRMLHEARQRTHAAEAELHATVERLRQAVAAREGVLAVVSHDLRGPLNNIGLAVNLLETGDEAQREIAISSVRRAVAHADRLISDLLDVARLSGDGLQLERQAIAVDSLIHTAIADVRQSAGAKRVELRTEIPADTGRVHVDRNRILQVLDNLLRNAIKYGADGGKVVVAVRTLDDAVEVSVSDDGPGLEPEARAHVFDRFWQANERAAAGGSGLGLAIAKGLVENHGGRIGVDRSDAGGARFWFTLPRAANV